MIDTMDNIDKMDNNKLAEIISKFEMPDGNYLIQRHGEFGESEKYWTIENKIDHQLFLLVCTYWHPGFEKEAVFYKENGFNIKKQIPRKIDTFEIPSDKDDPIRKFLYYDLYSLFLI